jgi:Fe-S cluster biosynthesis and repair protein YggX
MDINERIAQWQNMTEADPENAMGWMSLGNAYKEADRPEDAAKSLREAVNRDGKLSRAYQLLGEVLVGLGRDDEAAPVLTDGYTIAAEQGDVMPQKAMGVLLEKIGKPVPQVQAAAAPPVAVSGDQLVDRRTGRPGTRMPDPPMRGPMGQFIYDHFTQETWREWIGMGTKVINEFRLDFSNKQHQQIYEDQMLEWLGVSREEIEAYAGEQGN